jgi:ABC-type amino acid transport substrate-binding protein
MKKIWVFLLVVLALAASALAEQNDLEGIRKRGVLRHLGVPYANFVTGTGDGLSVELMQLFAEHLGVKYQFVQTSWDDSIADLTGKLVVSVGDDVKVTGKAPIKGDVISNGLTILPWREKVLSFSTPTFPTQVWLVARTDSGIHPITPSGNIEQDIAAVKAVIANKSVLGKLNTCLDPALYSLEAAGAHPLLFDGSLNDVAPAVINRSAETGLLDVPDALVAMGKWPGMTLIVGPISPQQFMGEGFRQEDDALRLEYNRFFAFIMANGTYAKLAKKYYPVVFDYYPEFFTN